MRLPKRKPRIKGKHPNGCVLGQVQSLGRVYRSFKRLILEPQVELFKTVPILNNELERERDAVCIGASCSQVSG